VRRRRCFSLAMAGRRWHRKLRGPEGRWLFCFSSSGLGRRKKKMRRERSAGGGSGGPRGFPLQCFAGCTQPGSVVKLDLSFPTQPG
jgi:hypothetical protein